MSRIFTLIFFLTAFLGRTQNLVPNPGFEEYSLKQESVHWTQPTGEFDHFYHENIAGRPLAPYEGKGYHCLCMYGYEINEFMHVKLEKKLEKGQAYRLSMQVRLSNMSDEVTKHENYQKLKNIYWYFTDFSINVKNKLFITAEPQVTFKITDKNILKWALLETEYYAAGDEEFLTIGNITRAFEKIQMDAAIKEKLDRLDSLKAEEEKEIDSLKKTLPEAPSLEKINQEEYDISKSEMVTGKPRKKPGKKKQAEYDRIRNEHSRISAYNGARINEVKDKYRAEKNRLEYQVEKIKLSFAVNFCFDNISIVKIPGKSKIPDENFALTIPEEGKSITLKNIYFETAKWDLLPASDKELNTLLKYMEKYPDMKIQVSGHTDNRGGDAYNLELSKNRAKAVYEFLVNKGIDSSRLHFEGYGSQMPVADNETDLSRSKNRRVEFTILEL
jgi:outer membrane protein OmpA-like peptidoglycan-associated protein